MVHVNIDKKANLFITCINFMSFAATFIHILFVYFTFTAHVYKCALEMAVVERTHLRKRQSTYIMITTTIAAEIVNVC